MSYTRPSDSDIDSLFVKYSNIPLQEGNKFPDTELVRRTPESDPKGPLEKFSTDAEFRGRRVVIFVTPGAFTPTCTGTHLAGFVEKAQEIYKGAIDQIYCLTPDKVDVALAWNRINGDPTKIKMLAYDKAKNVFALGLAANMSGARGQGLGMKRAAMIVNDLIVEWIQIEEEAKNCGITHANAVLAYLSQPRAADSKKRASTEME